MWNTRLDEAQDGIKIDRKNIINLRYADDTMFMAEREEDLKSFLMKMKEKNEKSWLKTQHKKKKKKKQPNRKTKIMSSSPITSWQINGETMETVTDFIFLGFQMTVDGDCNHEIKRCSLLVCNLGHSCKQGQRKSKERTRSHQTDSLLV